MSSPTITKSLRERIRSIADQQGGPTRLARAAGLAPSAVSQYLSEKPGRASEPSIASLIKLADAAGVSIGWLSAGRPPRSANSMLPEGYVLVPFFDLRASDWRIHTLQHPPSGWSALRREWLDSAGANVAETESFEAPEDVGLVISAGDLIAVDRSKGWRPDRATFELSAGALYLVAPEARVALRRLFWQRKGESIVAKAPGLRSEIIRVQQQAFQILGLVVARCGAVPAAGTVRQGSLSALK